MPAPPAPGRVDRMTASGPCSSRTMRRAVRMSGAVKRLIRMSKARLERPGAGLPPSLQDLGRNVSPPPPEAWRAPGDGNPAPPAGNVATPGRSLPRLRGRVGVGAARRRRDLIPPPPGLPPHAGGGGGPDRGAEDDRRPPPPPGGGSLPTPSPPPSPPSGGERGGRSVRAPS